MSHEETTLSGQVTDVFAHRFVVKTANAKVLADLSPKGAERISLKEGDRVELAGDMKPSELKVHSIAKNGAPPVHVDHHPKPHPRQLEHEEADPGRALKTVEANGFTVLGRPRRKPKHFEILGRDPAGDIVELHVELDGSLRKTRPVHEDDPKWATEIEVGR
jgi:translation initiation factor IF-1